MSERSFFGRFILYFSASLLQAAISLAAIPLTTHILGPKDFGAFSLVSSLVGLFSLVAEMGGNIVLSGNLRRASPEDARVLFSTLLLSSGAIGAICGAVLFFGWRLLYPLLGIGALPPAAVALAALTIVPNGLWATVLSFCLVAGRAAHASRLTVVMSLASFASTIAGLYGFHLGLVALFLGALAGPTAAVAFGLVGLRAHLAPRIGTRWFGAIGKAAPPAILSGFSAGAQTIVERSTLTAVAGVSMLGLYSHSQQYSAYMARVIKSVSNAVWPTSLDEAMDPASNFERLGQAWRAVYAGLTCAGIFLAFYSGEIVATLTHDKFTAAAPMVPVWIVYILLQNSGKPATATLFALRRGHLVSQIQTMATLAGIGLLLLLVPRFAQWGAIAALSLSMLVLRIVLTVIAARLRRLPFQDQWVIGGSLAILAALALELSLAPAPLLKAAICIAALGFAMFLARHTLSDFQLQVLRAGSLVRPGTSLASK